MASVSSDKKSKYNLKFLSFRTVKCGLKRTEDFKIVRKLSISIEVKVSGGYNERRSLFFMVLSLSLSRSLKPADTRVLITAEE